MAKIIFGVIIGYLMGAFLMFLIMDTGMNNLKNNLEQKHQIELNQSYQGCKMAIETLLKK